MWSPHWQDPKRAVLVPEEQWFASMQSILVPMANTAFGRELLCIEKTYPRIIRVQPSAVTAHLGGCILLSDIRSGAKFANVIRHRWQEFLSYSRYFLANVTVPVSPLTRFALSVVNTTDTFFPEADPATNAMDAALARSSAGAGETFTTIRTSTGTSVSASGTSIEAYLKASATSNQFNEMDRNLVYFYTGPTIPSADTISSATISFFGKGSVSTGLSQSVTVTSGTSASNTTVATTDFEIANYGSSDYITTRIADTAWSASAYNDFTMNATGIAAIQKGGTGVTKTAMRFSGDVDNSAPTWSSGAISDCNSAASDTAGTSNDPKLVVVHTSASTKLLASLGVG